MDYLKVWFFIVLKGCKFWIIYFIIVLVILLDFVDDSFVDLVMVYGVIEEEFIFFIVVLILFVDEVIIKYFIDCFKFELIK